MNETSRRILDHFQVRKTKKQKEEAIAILKTAELRLWNGTQKRRN